MITGRVFFADFTHFSGWYASGNLPLTGTALTASVLNSDRLGDIMSTRLGLLLAGLAIVRQWWSSNIAEW